ncbi:cyclic nucleotide-binding domain-containing protein [Coraliomargarita algicola]|uniref:Cyclic nucleotide-binding domain-containing protein n=1 Tax=Coraliomargarita algicola TaxID=3092156 RepID=A0ABZ0RJV6_9BACT|nr:cyclic nucleotide-binding domain-containing protein [Coraliomargarita sp. J2-16]WPJ95045.1 cyclic nucleotide-binding domain-containing protein [Coraliomargarita sp. J2-16]
MKIQKIPAGKLIFSEGDLGDEAYRVIEGCVEISIKEDGKRLVLATLGEGEIFGEMAMVESRPRSASARALEATTLSVIARDDFEIALSNREEELVPYLATIFDRLRVTNDRLLAALDKLDELEPTRPHRNPEILSPSKSAFKVQVEPDADEIRLQTALRARVVEHYPFQFGRRGELAGAEAVIPNQCLVADRAPYRVSRKHCILDSNADGVYVEDCGSSLGTIVNGIRIGGKSRETRVRLSSGKNSLVLGGADSQVRFVLTVTGAGEK